MTTSVSKGSKLNQISEFLTSIGALILSPIPSLVIWAKEIFAAFGSYFFYVGMGFDGINLLIRSFALFFTPNKNIQKISSLTMDWLVFAASLILMLSATALGVAGNVAIFGAMLALAPTICFIKAAWFLGKALMAKDEEQRDKYYNEVSNNMVNGILLGLVGVSFAGLFLIPGLPIAAGIAIAVVLTAILLPIAIYGISSKLMELGKWAKHKIKKWQRKNHGLQGPGYKYDLLPGTDLADELLEKKILYIDEVSNELDMKQGSFTYRFKDKSGKVHTGVYQRNELFDEWPIALSEINLLKPHLSTILLEVSKGGLVPFKPILRYQSKSKNELPQQQQSSFSENASKGEFENTPFDDLNEEIKFHREILQKQRDTALTLFQDTKRQNKIEALGILQQVLMQWNVLFKEDTNSQNTRYHSINLGLDFIDHVENLHTDLRVTQNRERIIKKIRQHILSNYPDVFQSFFNEQGRVELIFEKAFECMRKMKTQAEINKEKEEITEQITAYKTYFQGLRGKLDTKSQKIARDESVQYLEDVMDDKAQELENKEAKLTLFGGRGERYQIYHKIHALKKSEAILSVARKGLSS